MADLLYAERPALANMIDALPSYGQFIQSLGQATNCGSPESGAAWLLDFVSRYLERKGLRHGAVAAYDHCIYDIEGMDRVWPLAHATERAYRAQGLLVDCESPLPSLARFLVERMPSIWDGPAWIQHEPLSRSLVIADRIDYLVGFFGVGIMPTGSKDPYALRRAGKHFLMQVMFPITSLTHSTGGVM